MTEITFRNQFSTENGKRKKVGVEFSAGLNCFYTLAELMLLGDNDVNAGIARVIIELSNEDPRPGLDRPLAQELQALRQKSS